MQIDQIMGGKKINDGDSTVSKSVAKKSVKPEPKANLKSVPESIQEGFDGQSQDSRVSRQVEDIFGQGSEDPRQKNAWKKQSASALNKENLSKLTQITEEPKQIPPGSFEVDESLEKFLQFFCLSLIAEARSAPTPREIESYVDHYGK